MSERKQLSDDEIADLLGASTLFELPEPIPDEIAIQQKRFFVSVEHWLTRKVTLTEVQSKLLTPETLPSFRMELNEFVSAATDSHETWEFCSPQMDWNRLAGRSGFALVQDGSVTHVLVTLVS